MKGQQIRSTSATEYSSDDGQDSVLVSYATPVIYHASGQRPVVTDRKYSVTTSRHINEWFRRHDFDRAKATIASPEQLLAMWRGLI